MTAASTHNPTDALNATIISRNDRTPDLPIIKVRPDAGEASASPIPAALTSRRPPRTFMGLAVTSAPEPRQSADATPSEWSRAPRRR
jgi:hypothetical protein